MWAAGGEEEGLEADDEALVSAAWAHARRSLEATAAVAPAAPLPSTRTVAVAGAQGAGAVPPPSAAMAATAGIRDAQAAPTPNATVAGTAGARGAEAKNISKNSTLLQSGHRLQRAAHVQRARAWPPPHGYHHHIHHSLAVCLAMLILAGGVMGILYTTGYMALRRQLMFETEKQARERDDLSAFPGELPGSQANPFQPSLAALPSAPPRMAQAPVPAPPPPAAARGRPAAAAPALTRRSEESPGSASRSPKHLSFAPSVRLPSSSSASPRSSTSSCSAFPPPRRLRQADPQLLVQVQAGPAGGR